MNTYSAWENSKVYGQELSTDTFCVDNLILYMNYLDIAQLPTGYILDDYREYFDALLIETDVPSEFFYAPSAYSKFLYGSPELDFLVLYFAKIQTALEFNREKIKILPPERLNDVNQLILQYKDKVIESKENPVTYLLQ